MSTTLNTSNPAVPVLSPAPSTANASSASALVESILAALAADNVAIVALATAVTTGVIHFTGGGSFNGAVLTFASGDVLRPDGSGGLLFNDGQVTITSGFAGVAPGGSI